MITTPPTAPIRTAVAAYIAMPNSPAARDNRIVSITISTLDPAYASVTLSSKSAGPSMMVLHHGLGSWWVEGFGSSLSCDSAPKAVLSELHVGCSPPDGVAWIDDCGPLLSKPMTLTITCADGNYGLAALRWRNWGTATATATGHAFANDCTPNCAAGHFHTYAMTATVTKLTACGRARYYARLTIAYEGERPKGIAPRDRIVLGC